MAKVFLIILNYKISSMAFSHIIFESNFPKKYRCFLNDMDSLPVFSVFNAFKNHPSIKNIKSENFNSTFFLGILKLM